MKKVCLSLCLLLFAGCADLPSGIILAVNCEQGHSEEIITDNYFAVGGFCNLEGIPVTFTVPKPFEVCETNWEVVFTCPSE